MKRKPMSIKRLSRLLDRCFNGNVRMTFVQSAEAPAPTWEDVRMIAFDAYMAALRDVVNALEGDASPLKELVSPDGLTVVLDPENDFSFLRVPPEELESDAEPENEGPPRIWVPPWY